MVIELSRIYKMIWPAPMTYNDESKAEDEFVQYLFLVNCTRNEVSTKLHYTRVKKFFIFFSYVSLESTFGVYFHKFVKKSIIKNLLYNKKSYLIR